MDTCMLTTDQLLPCRALTKAVGDEHGALAWVGASYPGPGNLGYVTGATLEGKPLIYCPWCGAGIMQKPAP